MPHLGPVLKGKTIALHFLFSAAMGWNAVVMAGAGVAILGHVREGNILRLAEQPAGRSLEGWGCPVNLELLCKTEITFYFI